MEAILKFNLDKPDELDVYNRVVQFMESDLTIDPMEKLRKIKSKDMAVALFGINNSRKKVVWEIESLEEKNVQLNSEDIINKVYERINIILDNNGIVIDELIE